MKFKYFDKPELFADFKDKPEMCDLCGETTMCLDAELFSGEDDLSSVCPQCLAGGRLYDRDLYSCTGDVARLKAQIKGINPKLTDTEVDGVVNKKTLELTKTTPKLITWQDWAWPCADGDYCKFIGYGSKSLFRLLATEGLAKHFFKVSFYDAEMYNDDLWDDLPDVPLKDYNDSTEYGVVFYIFKSLHSEKIVTIWDCC